MKLNNFAWFCLGGTIVALTLIQVSRLGAQKASVSEAEIIRQFNILYYGKMDKTWGAMHWFGVPTQKYPTDMWVYQEIMYGLRPDLIVEAGTYLGGSALYMAQLCDQLGKGRIVTLDIVNHQPRPKHPRVDYVIASSTSKEAEAAVRERVKPGNTVMVVLDSDHSKKHVLAELRLYSKYVSVGSYLIVEDSNLNGNPVVPGFGAGPMEAIDEFLRGNSQYQIDSSRERLMLTANPKGYLKRVR